MESVSGTGDGAVLASAGSSWDLGSLAASDTGTRLAATRHVPPKQSNHPTLNTTFHCFRERLP